MEIKLAAESQGHRHVAIINDTADENGVIGVTSESEGHSHPIVFMPEQQEQVDPQTGQVIQPYTPQAILVLPDPEDNHTHDLKSIPKVMNKTFSKSEKESYRKLAVDLYKEAKSLDETGLIKMGIECEKFYMGDQWPAGELQKRNNNGLTTLTVNLVQHPVNVLVGFQIQNQTDIVFKPTEEGDQVKADLLNEVTKIVCEHTDLSDEKVEVFYDQVITGRGSFNVYIDNVQNPEGDIVISHVPFDTIFYGAHRKKNLKDCQAVAMEKWVTKVELRSKVSKKDRHIIDNLPVFTFDAEYNSPGTYEFSDGRVIDGQSIKMKDKKWVDEVAKKVKVITVQFKIYEKDDFIIHDSGFVYHVDPGLDEDIQAGLFTLPGMDAFEKDREKTILVEIACEDILLRIVETPGDMLTAVAAYATKRGNKVKGKVEDLLDPTREINYIRSKMVDIVRTMAGRGYYYSDGTFNSDNDKTNWKNGVSGDGFMAEVGSLSQIPVKEEGASFPSDLANHLGLLTKDLERIMGINEELMGMSSNSTSNVMIQSRKNAALIGSEYIFEGMSIAMKRLGKVLLRLYPYVFSGERVWRMLRNTELKAPVMIAGKKLSEFSKKEIEDIWDSIGDVSYDVAVTEAPFSNTKRERDFQAWANLATQGVIGVDARTLLQLSDLPPDQKAISLEYAEQAANASNQIQQKRLDIENEKTQIAAMSRETIESAKLQQKDKIDTANVHLKAIQLGQEGGR